MKLMIDYLKKPLLITITLLVLCGVAYPLLMTGISLIVFPHQANGSLIEVDGKVIGSELIGQEFTADYFMKCRPSAIGYNTYTEEDVKNGTYSSVGSGSQNLAASNPKLIERVEKDIENFLDENPTVKREDIPTDLLTASGSGLDPHISPEAAEIQLERISAASKIGMERLQEIVRNNTTKKAFGFFGEDTVNVLKVNLEIAKEMGFIESIQY